MTATSELLEAIEKTLPAIQVETLRKSLNELEQVKREKTALQESVKLERERTQDAQAELRQARSDIEHLRERLETATSERDTYKGQQRDAELAALRAQVEATNTTTDKFLKNTVYRETLQHQIPTEFPQMAFRQGQYGQEQYQVGTSKGSIPTTDVKETASE